jgi:hypothetical protein
LKKAYLALSKVEGLCCPTRSNLVGTRVIMQ